VSSSIKSLLVRVLNMSVPVFTYDGRGEPVMKGEVSVRATLLETLFDPSQVAILEVRRDPEVDRDVFNYRLECILARGISHRGKTFRILGGSSSIKDGKLWLGTEEVRRAIHRYFLSAQEALTYFGIFTSGCYHGIHELTRDIRVVPDGELGTGDGMGFIPRPLVLELVGMERQVQVRLVGKDWLAKGTLHPHDGREIILPQSMIKGKDMPVSGRCTFHLGIRDIAATRPYGSNFTILQWFDRETITRLIPAVEQALADLQGVLSDREKALAFLGRLAEDSEERTTLERFLKAGVPPTHRWIHARLKELLRKRYIQLALGGAVDLQGAMTAYKDLPSGRVCMPDLPEGPCVVSRYPVRDRLSFLAAINDHDLVSGALPGSIYIGPDDLKQLDGDYDGDYCIVTQDEAVLDAVWRNDWTEGYERLPEGTKTRKKDPLEMLPFAAVEALGNAVGYITYLITSAVLNDREDLVPALSLNLQLEVQGIKWSTRADRKFLKSVADVLEIPELFRRLNTDRRLFVKELPELSPELADRPMFRVFATVMEHWQVLDGIPRDLPYFKALVPLREIPDELLEETRSVVSLYNSWVSELITAAGEKEPDLTAPIEFIRSWGASKQENREAWATALWHIVHASRSPISTGSAAFHAFEDVMATLIKHRPGPAPTRETEDLHRANLHSVPCVGGYYSMPGSSTGERIRTFRAAVRNLGRIAEVSVAPNELDPEGCDFVAGDLRLGSLPRDYRHLRPFRVGDTFQAYITCGHRALYLHIIR
jgi:hypothetical protein